MALPHFTPREEQVLEQLTNGVTTTKHLGRALGMQPGTVKVHVHNICLKLGTPNKTAIVARLLREERKIPENKVLPSEYHFQWRKG